MSETANFQKPRDVVRTNLVVLLVVGILALVVRLGIFTFRGTAWGARARANATREAREYLSVRYGVVSPAVICHTETLNGAKCEAVIGPVVVVVTCDDDESVTNDGCKYESSMPLGTQR